MKIYHYLLVVFILFHFNNASGQTTEPISWSKNSGEKSNSTPPDFCGTDFFHKERMKDDINYKAKHVQTFKSLRKTYGQQKTSVNGVVQIPVVVHIMHVGEAVGTGTNISDEDVRRGIKNLNNYWRKVAGTIGFGEGVDMKIEFALAVQDENGNVTNGIDRVDMSGVPAYVSNGVNRRETGGIANYLPGGEVNSLKEYSIWNTRKYYNVWLINKIDNKNCSSGESFTAGYANYSAAHGRLYDGTVVLICTYLNDASYIWAHEMGHAFNLPHTFDNDDPDTGTCGDDNIIDTPKHIRTSSIRPSIYRDCGNTDANDCDLSFNQIINPDTGFRRNSGTHQDHMHNYMDYTGCASEFTGGQRQVALAALNNDRASFLTSEALTPPEIATVDFTAETTAVCIGSALTFTETSTGTPNSYTNEKYDDITFLWTFDNGTDTPYTSTDQNPSITFNNPGVYDVTLSVTNTHGTTRATKTDYVIVSPNTVTGMGTCVISSTNNGNNFRNGVTRISFNTLKNRTSTFIPNNALHDFVCSKGTKLEANKSYDLKIDYRARPGGRQFLEAWIDWDNSGSFDTSNTNGVNERVLADDIAESSKGQALVSVVPPATAVRNTILRMRVVSEYDKSPILCGNGRGQRADDYGIYVMDDVLSTNDFTKSDSRLRIAPNPVQDYLNISLDNVDEIKGYQVYDISGKKVMSNSKVTQKGIEVLNLSNGFYFLKIKTITGREFTGKFIKE
ncbi:T9SS type A sorting domain-containing protein [Flavivirga eckloniae]|uniref:PKD domain-containing protein n=1 Tax=Flavivirga eckloniae TaxID=1803846 RepID=A0A2K9PUU2_9FLAO|nr:T9SS type A sorting domain-containing protein [Flavivirga eckloniae]AUP80819.1 hypothetical protein C1H87_19725 [Flavivirga eckloniae]